MINVQEIQNSTIFKSEELEDLSIVASVCACNNPTRMFWFTPEELSEEFSEEYNE